MAPKRRAAFPAIGNPIIGSDKIVERIGDIRRFAAGKEMSGWAIARSIALLKHDTGGFIFADPETGQRMNLAEMIQGACAAFELRVSTITRYATLAENFPATEIPQEATIGQCEAASGLAAMPGGPHLILVRRCVTEGWNTQELRAAARAVKAGEPAATVDAQAALAAHGTAAGTQGTAAAREARRTAQLGHLRAALAHLSEGDIEEAKVEILNAIARA